MRNKCRLGGEEDELLYGELADGYRFKMMASNNVGENLERPVLLRLGSLARHPITDSRVNERQPQQQQQDSSSHGMNMIRYSIHSSSAKDLVWVP